ncbi:cyclodeaminase/cyclohydrolase family protein [Iodobacter sp.]|uniref:cyclodeaminase/cyclohydrolase family protein n=1 Tax=Iodobacter sp. TaxID=1915058 RepID=UPI0025D59A84|nr:cyclodeaminase/cyclohydrolase family protein [Iodobacter sp.]
MKSIYSHIPNSIPSLFEAAASTNPVPGGGSVVCTCANLGVALLLKAIRITLKSDSIEKLVVADLSFQENAENLLSFAQRDANVFFQYISALNLPKQTTDEQVNRVKHIEKAAIDAIALGVLMAETGNDILKTCIEIKPLIKRTIVADIHAGAYLVSAMVSVAIENARANLLSIKGNLSYHELDSNLLNINDIHMKLISDLLAFER